jgi:hypothetical protein
MHKNCTSLLPIIIQLRTKFSLILVKQETVIYSHFITFREKVILIFFICFMKSTVSFQCILNLSVKRSSVISLCFIRITRSFSGFVVTIWFRRGFFAVATHFAKLSNNSCFDTTRPMTIENLNDLLRFDNALRSYTTSA